MDVNSRKLKKNKISLKLTEKEVDLIIYLLNSNSEKSALDLQKDVWKHITDLETHTVETHIYRLRKKINEKFEDNNFIINNAKGYKLFLWKKEILLPRIFCQKNIAKKNKTKKR